ncbi:MAG TPA: hypothetical protein VFN96_04855 [Gemmatimonadales bacterium]|nr:hypothetical protein [Gemmatimonadales bacterium]
MRTASRAILLAASLVAAPGVLFAAPREPGAPLPLLRQQVTSGEPALPRAIPEAGPGGETLDLGSLDDPVALEQRLRRLLDGGVGGLRLTLVDGVARFGDFSVGSSESLPGHLLVLEGRADVFGRISGNVVSLDGDIVMHPGAVVEGDALALNGRIRNLGGLVRGEQRAFGEARAAAPARSPVEKGLLGGAGLAGMVLTLLLIGSGLVLFARPNLEVVSDTVTHSFLRSFLAGLLAQVLMIPTFGMLLTGLVLSVVGILLVPFVVVVIPLLLLAAVVGGFLAVAHAMGETHVRRRMAAGVIVGSPNSYRYLFTGLFGFAAVWLVWVLFGWVPVAGGLVFAAAAITTWLLATVGLGACLLSRAGVQPGFSGRYIPPEALTDEYLWATPQFGVTAVKRPPKLRDDR